jgi:hypothetical protein
MRILSFITEAEVICEILEYLHLWAEEERIRPPPTKLQQYHHHLTD